MDGQPLVVRGSRVVTPGGGRPASIHVANGSIVRVAAFDDVPVGMPIVEAGQAVVLPGLVDTHVHVNEPGRADWEGFPSATRAAAAGGVTTIVDMPLNAMPPTTTPEALAAKVAAARGRAVVDVGFWGGAVPSNAGALGPLHAEGVFGFKCFLVDSGVEEFPPLDVDGLRAAAREVAALGSVLLVHAELPGPIDAATARLAAEDPRRYGTYLASRPPEAEIDAVRAVIEASRATGARAHVLHLSAAAALDHLRAARADGFPITAETCPHYLALSAEEIPDGATAFKCAPPIRDAENRDRLWEGLRDGTIDGVVSDHSPCPPERKLLDEGDFLRAWGGIISLQLGLRVVWTEARRRGHSLEEVVRWMGEGPARLAGLRTKGAIAEGFDADLVLFDPDRSVEVDPSTLHHRHPITPYAGRRLDGEVVATYLRGVQIYRDGVFDPEPRGRLLRMGQA